MLRQLWDEGSGGVDRFCKQLPHHSFIGIWCEDEQTVYLLCPEKYLMMYDIRIDVLRQIFARPWKLHSEYFSLDSENFQSENFYVKTSNLET